MSNTPRTDAAIRDAELRLKDANAFHDMCDFARDLERELVEQQERAAKAVINAHTKYEKRMKAELAERDAYAGRRSEAIKGLLEYLPELWGDQVVEGELMLRIEANAIHAALGALGSESHQMSVAERQGWPKVIATSRGHEGDDGREIKLRLSREPAPGELTAMVCFLNGVQPPTERHAMGVEPAVLMPGDRVRYVNAAIRDLNGRCGTVIERAPYMHDVWKVRVDDYPNDARGQQGYWGATMASVELIERPAQGAAPTYCGRCDEDTPTNSNGTCPICTKIK